MQFHLQHLVVVVVVIIILFVVYTVAPEGAFLPAAGLVAGAVGVGAIANLLLNFVSGDSAETAANAIPEAKDEVAKDESEHDLSEQASVDGLEDEIKDSGDAVKQPIDAEPVQKSVSIREDGEGADGEPPSPGASPQARRSFSRPGTKQRIKPMVYAAPI